MKSKHWVTYTIKFSSELALVFPMHCIIARFVDSPSWPWPWRAMAAQSLTSEWLTAHTGPELEMHLHCVCEGAKRQTVNRAANIKIVTVIAITLANKNYWALSYFLRLRRKIMIFTSSKSFACARSSGLWVAHGRKLKNAAREARYTYCMAIWQCMIIYGGYDVTLTPEE